MCGFTKTVSRNETCLTEMGRTVIITLHNIRVHSSFGRERNRGGQLNEVTGIIRKVDELGRIVLPIELRRTLDIAERDELEIYMEGDRIILQKFEPSCIFCSSSRELVSYRGKNICQECIRSMGKY